MKRLLAMLRPGLGRPNSSQAAIALASTGADLDHRTVHWYVDKLVVSVLFVAGISAILFILSIVFFVFEQGLVFIVNTMDFREFFTSPRWRPTSEYNTTYGILALIAGTASITGLAILIAVPFSIGAAIYISEFATGKTKESLKVCVELLAAIPSVVWGFIGLSIMNGLIIQIFDVPVGLNMLNAGLILALMAAPIMTSIAEDALKAVPDRYREAAEAMGANRWQVIAKVVLPAAKNGLLGGVLLGMGRAFGETMAVLMASGHSITIPNSIFDSVRALTATVAAELGETAVGSDHYGALFTIGIFLFFITFIVNLSADLIVRGIREE